MARAFARADVAPLKRLAFYYGFPSAVNGAGGSLDRAIDAFKEFDLVVFGDTVEFPPIQDGHRPGARLRLHAEQPPRPRQHLGHHRPPARAQRPHQGVQLRLHRRREHLPPLHSRRAASAIYA